MTATTLDTDAFERVETAAENIGGPHGRRLREAVRDLNVVCSACLTESVSRFASLESAAGTAESEGLVEAAEQLRARRAQLVLAALVRHLEVRCTDLYPVHVA